MRDLESIFPSPTLVISLGEFAGNLLPWVQSLFLQSDPRRAAMIGFFRAVVGDDGSKETTLEAIGGEVGREPSSLDSALHELRLHEKFLQVGLGDARDVPLGVILLADLTEKDSGALYTLLDAIFEKMKDEPGGYMYLLCKTAAFESDPMRNQRRARLHLHLTRFEKLTASGDWKLQTCLFDGLKEGSLEAKDEHEIGLLMQNFLLALLLGRMAQNLAQAYSLAAGDQQGSYFQSAGATALVYDPSFLQETCAVPLAMMTLENEFLSGTLPDPLEIEKVANSIADAAGSESAWAEKMSGGTPYRTKSDQPIGLELHLSELQFEGLPPQEWGDAIVGYADYFEKGQQARSLEMLRKNSASLGQALINAMETHLSALPARSALYPGGISASLKVIQEGAGQVYRRIQTCLPEQNEEERAAVLDGGYQSAIERLDEAISAMPDAPRWTKRVPGKLYAYAIILFEFLFLRREHAQLILLREEIVAGLEDKFIFQFEQELRRHLVQLCHQQISILEKTQSELDALQSKFQSLKDRIDGRKLPAFSDSSPFRANLVTPALLEWAYARGDKDCAGIRAELLEEGYLDDWRGISEEDLYQGLLGACRNAFQFVHEFKAEEILKRAGIADFSAVLVALSLGAVPALRPDFDRAGESVSYLSNYFSCADPRESDIAGVLGAGARQWQEIPTGDPYKILFCRVRQMIPLGALSFLTQPAQAAFESLDEQEQKELQEWFERERS